MNFWTEEFGRIRQRIKADVLDARILCIQVGGSHAHNTATTDSDVDYEAVYATPLRSLVCIPPVCGSFSSKEGEKPDWIAYEVRHYGKLLASGNPGSLGMLLRRHMVETTPDWDAACATPRQFVSNATIDRHLGYLNGQMERLRKDAPLHTTGGNYNTKWAYHAARLAIDAVDLATGRVPPTWKVGLMRRTLMDIREGRWSKQEVETFVTGLVEDVNNRKPWPWPDDKPVTQVNEWLLRIYEKERC